MKAEIKRGDARFDPPFPLRGADTQCGKGIGTLTRNNFTTPEDRHARTLQGCKVAQAIPGEIRRGARQLQHIAPGANTGCGGGFHHGGHAHAACQQFAGKLQIERPAARDHRAIGGADALRTRKCLQRARGHDARHSPARHRHWAFMRAWGQDQPARAESNGGTFYQRGDFIRREAAPHCCAVMKAHARLPCTGKKRAALAELRIWRSMAVAGGKGFQILAARRFTFIQHHHIRARFGSGDGGGKPSGAGTDHQNIAGLIGYLRGRVAKRGGFRREGACHRHAIGHLHHAGALAGLAIHRHHAIKTSTHAAPKPALGALGGFAQRQNARSRKRGGDAFPRQRLHRLAVEADLNRRLGRGDIGVLQPHALAVCAKTGSHHRMRRGRVHPRESPPWPESPFAAPIRC